MLVKQKEANRQSMLLLHNAEPSVQLLKALEDVAAATKTLEEERLQHQQKVKPGSFVVRMVARVLAIRFSSCLTVVPSRREAFHSCLASAKCVCVCVCRCRAWKPSWSRAV